jgi:general L-amino acid transport system permease protein
LPELAGFNYKGGFRFSSEFSALLIGLSVYTGAYIAEIVRSGLQAVAKGQREAAGAVGLNQQQTLRLIVLPQAIPIIVPPLTSQYLNLAKNSSLAVAIGFPDVFSIGNTMMSHTGQAIPVFAMIMVSYLIMSLTTSAAMNWYNKWINRMKK